jgi:hypothetical protein
MTVKVDPVLRRDADAVVGNHVVDFSSDKAREIPRRWELVEQRERTEQAASPIEERFDELERLMLSVRDFGWDQALDDDAPVRARWARLRTRLASDRTTR